MICTDCKVGATFNEQGNYDKSEELHDLCRGDCGCQHRTGPGWFVKANGKATLMQTQSP
jgi:hypothetical protein